MESRDPYALFDAWYAEARASEINDSNAMALATADAEGHPSVRMVLLKGHGPDADGVAGGGFIFYTNLESRKGGELAENPNVALLFHWKSLRRQIQVRGMTSREDGPLADGYYASRSLKSRLGAWASAQSQPLSSRAALMACGDAVEILDGWDQLGGYDLSSMLNNPGGRHPATKKVHLAAGVEPMIKSLVALMAA